MHAACKELGNKGQSESSRLQGEGQGYKVKVTGYKGEACRYWLT